MVNGRRKGHGFERDIALILNKKYNITEDKDKWKRVPMSGGFDKVSFPGDIFTMSPLLNTEECIANKFSIECKFHKDWNIEDLINGNKSPILEWWDQAANDANIGGKQPLLIMKKNRSKVFYMARIETIEYERLLWANSFMFILPNENQYVQIGMFDALLESIYAHDRRKINETSNSR